MNKLFASALISIISAQALAAGDFKATNCEIFIDKVAGHQVNYHGAFGAIVHTEVLLKIDLSQTGPISKVVFFSNLKSIDNNGDVTSETGFREVRLFPYFGAADYYIADLGDLENHWWDSSNTADANVHEGAFYVERADGVRLWANPSSNFGEHFLFDKGTADTVHREKQIYIGSGSFPFGAASLIGLGQVKKAADFNTYWNPARCR